MIKKKKRLIFNYIRVTLIFLFIFSFFVSSAEAMGLGVSPTKVRLFIPPGQRKSGSIKFKNYSQINLKVRAYLEDWQYDSTHTGTKEFKPQATLPLSCAQWISFAPAEFTLPPFGTQTVGFSVNVPQDASGGRYAVIFFETVLGEAPPAETEGGGVTVTVLGRVGTLFYIEPQGTISKKVNLSHFEVKRDSNAGPLEVTLDLENIGNVDIAAAGSFHIMDREGLIYARQEFKEVYTFPGETVKLSATWKESIPKGKYDLVITLDTGKALEDLGLGRGPVILKEAEIEIGNNGEVLRVGMLK